ncbi:MAG: protein translocase subunit SecF, partial [Elusimicrobiota bacterium]
HDVLIVFGLLTFFGITIDLVVVAALLTLAGYSVNDSIVVYDRIRENIKLHYKKPLGEIIDLSINDTLSRTIITSGTTLVVVLALLLRGGEVLHGFSVALFAGILIGTYSSVFVAAPLVYAWQSKK